MLITVEGIPSSNKLISDRKIISHVIKCDEIIKHKHKQQNIQVEAKKQLTSFQLLQKRDGGM
jgi:hypothetical protein